MNEKEIDLREYFKILQKRRWTIATLSIIIWHFYNVHFNPEVFPMSWTWWHGQLTESEMKHHHPLEYEEIIKKESAQIIQQSEYEEKESN